MPYYKTSQEWLEQSTLLLEARPSTTRITTRYSIKTPKSSRRKADAGDAAAAESPAATEKPPRGSLVIKTYDPVSGVTLKYRTTKAAEVTRLIHASLGKLGRGMAAVPEVLEEAMPDAPATAVAEGQSDAATGGTEQKGTQQATSQQQQQGQQGGGKKKKKGKK